MTWRNAGACLFLGCLCVIALCGCGGSLVIDTQSLLSPKLMRSEVVGIVAGFGTTFAAVPDLVAMTKSKQKIFTSIEVNPKFADTGEAYLTGLGVTDSPASLGTEVLAFAAKNPDASPFKQRKSHADALFSVGVETVLEVEPSSTTIKVIDQILVTSVKTRPLTLDEIKDKGIVLDSDDYLGFEFTLAMSLDSKAVNFSFPVVFNRQGVAIPPPIPDDLATVKRELTLHPDIQPLMILLTDGAGNVSAPSALDYATTASNLFTPVSASGLIRGVHVRELRLAVDAMRAATPNLGPYTAGWTSYTAPTGLVLASHFTALRTALDQATMQLVGRTVPYTGAAPAQSGKIYAYQVQQIQEGVK